MAQPKTMAELKTWYQEQDLPPETETGLFIGKNSAQHGACGLYRDEKGIYIVYENRQNGTRRVLYKGPAEEHAVQEMRQLIERYTSTWQYDSDAFDATDDAEPYRGGRVSFISDPSTIAELARWYRSEGLPPERTTRFFIGKDVTEPRAFGIYQAGTQFIVYMNRSDGERIVRYQGEDEAAAVNKLYQRLLKEIEHQRANGMHDYGHIGQRNGDQKETDSDTFGVKSIIVVLVVFVTLMCLLTQACEHGRSSTADGPQYAITDSADHTQESYGDYDPAGKDSGSIVL